MLAEWTVCAKSCFQQLLSSGTETRYSDYLHMTGTSKALRDLIMMLTKSCWIKTLSAS